ncbi:MAG: hypothetical protein HY651_07835 [Acidobacteria bacterium]|nr:hypothetical protein [Acidobacteriota bacterium]
MIQNIALRFLLMVCGATMFWGPVTIATFLTKRELSIFWGTSLSSTFFLLSYLLLRRKSSQLVRSNLLWMLWGVFLLGGLFSMIAFTAMGAGFYGLHGWEVVRMFLIALIPGWIALYGSIGMGTLPGLLLISALTAVIHLKLERKEPTNKSV